MLWLSYLVDSVVLLLSVLWEGRRTGARSRGMAAGAPRSQTLSSLVWGLVQRAVQVRVHACVPRFELRTDSSGRPLSTVGVRMCLRKVFKAIQLKSIAWQRSPELDTHRSPGMYVVSYRIVDGGSWTRRVWLEDCSQ